MHDDHCVVNMCIVFFGFYLIALKKEYIRYLCMYVIYVCHLCITLSTKKRPLLPARAGNLPYFWNEVLK